MDMRPAPQGDLFVELPTGEVFQLERREHLLQAGVSIADAPAALAYVRFLHHHVAFATQAPSYCELAPELRTRHEVFAVAGLDAAGSPVSVREQHEGDTRWFQVVRHAVSRASLPRELRKPQPLTGVLRLDETVHPDGRSTDRKSTRLNSSHSAKSRMPSSA